MKRMLVRALDEAGQQGRQSADVEDLLAAVAADPDSAGSYLLDQCGIDASQVLGRETAMGDKLLPQAERAVRLEMPAVQIVRAAAAEATRLGHDHVGTEHVISALARSNDLELTHRLNDAGLTPARAERAVRQWEADGMPRRRGGWGFAAIRPRSLAMLLHPAQKLLRWRRILWGIYFKKSLGHPGFVSNPYPLYRWLREHEPVRKDPLAPVWILTRYDDVQEMLRDPRFRKDPFALERLPRMVREQIDAGDETRIATEEVSMLFLDPPGHTRVRGIFSRAFTPASLAQMRPGIERVARDLIDRASSPGQMDIIADLAYPLPVIVIAELLGFPAEDYPKIKQWSDEFAASLALNAPADQQQRTRVAWTEIRDYFDAVVERSSGKNADTLLSKLLQTECEAEGLNREEIFSNCVLLLAAGHETTTNLIGNGLLALMLNRDQWDLLVREPGLIDSTVEELLRFDSPVQWTSRLSGETIEIAGKTIQPGEVLLGATGAANRDPAKFSDPDRLDIRRAENRHLAFGTGIHFCLGAALARMEMQIVLREMSSRFPNMTLAQRRVKWNKGLTFRGVKSLRVKLG